MGKYAQLVIGPAGTGKSTYCHTAQSHAAMIKRNAAVINLDPAVADTSIPYVLGGDIRELISLEDAMDEMSFGPIGGLLFCMEYLTGTTDGQQWLEETIDAVTGSTDDAYVIFDLPGQIELYTHLDVMNRIIELLNRMNFKICSVYLIDSSFALYATKLMSAMLTALSAMVKLEVPHITLLTKSDLVSKEVINKITNMSTMELQHLLDDEERQKEKKRRLRYGLGDGFAIGEGERKRRQPFQALNRSMCEVLGNFNMVNFVPLDITDDDSVAYAIGQVDFCLQFGEDEEPMERYAIGSTEKEHD
eukprot:g3995.t1